MPPNISQASYNVYYQHLVDAAEHPDSHLLQLYDTEAGKMAAIAVWCSTKPTSGEEWERKSEKRQMAYPDAQQDIVGPFLREKGEARKRVMGQRRWWGE